MRLKLKWTVILYKTGDDNLIFCIEPLSLTWYLLGVFHGWFHLHGLTRAANIANWQLKNEKNSCPQRDSNWRPLDCEVTTVTIRRWDLIYHPQVKMTPEFTCVIYIYIITCGRVFCHVYSIVIINICIILLFDQYTIDFGQIANETNVIRLQYQIHDKTLCCDYDVDINSSSKSWWHFNLTIVYQIP